MSRADVNVTRMWSLLEGMLPKPDALETMDRLTRNKSCLSCEGFADCSLLGLLLLELVPDALEKENSEEARETYHWIQDSVEDYSLVNTAVIVMDAIVNDNFKKETLPYE